MTRILAFALALVAVALLGVTDGSAVRGQNTKLTGTVGPGYFIILKNAEGSRVSNLVPGTYDIQVEDLSEEHSFHLVGPGLDRLTPVGSLASESWTVTFTNGTYRYNCDAHATTMRGSFTVGSTPTPTPTPTPPVVTPKTKLVLTSGPSFKITLKTAAGKAVKQMTRGTYRMLVSDRSTSHNAHIKAPGGVDRKTTVPFVGKQTWRVKLAQAGTLRFLCDVHAAAGMRGSAKIVR